MEIGDKLGFPMVLLFLLIGVQMFTIYSLSEESMNDFLGVTGMAVGEPDYVCPARQEIDGQLNPESFSVVGVEFTTFPSNKSQVYKRKDGTRWEVKTNTYGLREEDFSRDKDQEVFRILVLGDSYTFGWGINRSDRFTDKLEERLDSHYDREIEVINMGRTGAGMRDYYLALRDKGVSYDPDLVITSFYQTDEVSYKDLRRIEEKLMNRHDLNSTEEISKSKEFWRDWRDLKSNEARYEGWNNSELQLYGNAIADFTRQEDVQEIFFLFNNRKKGIGEKFREDLLGWEKHCNVDLVLPPNELYKKPISEWQLPFDAHFNPEYNSIMADKLFMHIVSEGYIDDSSPRE